MVKTTVAALTLMLALADPAGASSCLHPIVVPVDFPRVGHVWIHRGKGTTFPVHLEKGARIIVHGTLGTLYGMTLINNPDTWMMSISSNTHPAEVTELGDEHGLDFTAPETGDYTIVASPCGDWGQPGTVQVSLVDEFGPTASAPVPAQTTPPANAARSSWSHGRMAMLPLMTFLAAQNEYMQCYKAQLIARSGGGRITCPKPADLSPLRDALARLTPAQTTCIDAVHDAGADDPVGACQIPADKAADVAIVIDALDLVARWQ